MDLTRRLDKILQVCASEEVSQVDEFAVAFVFHVDGAPSVLAPADCFAVDGYAFFAADDGEGDDGLAHKSG